LSISVFDYFGSVPVLTELTEFFQAELNTTKKSIGFKANLSNTTSIFDNNNN
jgi:hypothetical protein